MVQQRDAATDDESAQINILEIVVFRINHLQILEMKSCFVTIVHISSMYLSCKTIWISQVAVRSFAAKASNRLLQKPRQGDHL